MPALEDLATEMCVRVKQALVLEVAIAQSVDQGRYHDFEWKRLAARVPDRVDECSVDVVKEKWQDQHEISGRLFQLRFPVSQEIECEQQIRELEHHPGNFIRNHNLEEGVQLLPIVDKLVVGYPGKYGQSDQGAYANCPQAG